MTTLILRTTAKVVLPVVVVYSFALFLQGHNLPGGGFIAGVLTAIGVSLVYMAYGVGYLETTLLQQSESLAGDHYRGTVVLAYRLVFALGLATAVAGGFAAVALGHPFLSQTYVETHAPLYGEIELASAVVFDLGVYLGVVGALLTVVSVLGGETD